MPNTPRPVALCLRLATLAGAALVPAMSSGQVRVLDFEWVGPAQHGRPILDYYDGGLSGGPSPAGPGPAFGVAFSPNALGVCRGNIPGCVSNFAGAPSPLGVLGFREGSAATMTVPGGFTSGFSFFYTAIFAPGTIRVFDGLNGTGNVLATLDLPLTPSLRGSPRCADYPDAFFCPLVPIGVAFGGVARSVDFGGTADQIGFDNITLGAVEPGVVPGPTVTPEPTAYALVASGIAGIAGVAGRRRRWHAR
jgi:hypothetical protein